LEKKNFFFLTREYEAKGPRTAKANVWIRIHDRIGKLMCPYWKLLLFSFRYWIIIKLIYR
jgi:hypothetical protein